MRSQLHWIWVYHIKHRAARRRDAFWQWVAWHLPKGLITWCYVRVGAHATTGEYGDTVVPELGMMDALKRWTD